MKTTIAMILTAASVSACGGGLEPTSPSSTIKQTVPATMQAVLTIEQLNVCHGTQPWTSCVSKLSGGICFTVTDTNRNLVINDMAYDVVFFGYAAALAKGSDDNLGPDDQSHVSTLASSDNGNTWTKGECPDAS